MGIPVRNVLNVRKTKVEGQGFCPAGISSLLRRRPCCQLHNITVMMDLHKLPCAGNREGWGFLPHLGEEGRHHRGGRGLDLASTLTASFSFLKVLLTILFGVYVCVCLHVCKSPQHLEEGSELQIFENCVFAGPGNWAQAPCKRSPCS